MKLVCLFCLLFSSLNIYSQAVAGKYNIIFPKGRLMRFHTYRLSFDSSFKGYVTYGARKAYELNDYDFYFVADINEYLRIYNINKQNDTTLIDSVYIKVKDPEYTLLFHDKRSGATIDRKEIRNSTIQARLFNADISLRFTIDSAKLRYAKGQKVIQKSFTGNIIPDDIADEILKSKTKIIVIDVVCSYNGQPIILVPAVFFIK